MDKNVIEFRLLAPNETSYYANRAKKRMCRALDFMRGAILFEDILPMLASGEMLMVLIYKNSSWVGECTIQPQTWPRKKFLSIFTLSGEGAKDWLEALIHQLLAFQAILGYDGLTTCCRLGWKRLLPPAFHFETSLGVHLHAR